jgi:hypothetical protein
LHLRDALRDGGNRSLEKTDFPSTQGHSHVPTRSHHPAHRWIEAKGPARGKAKIYDDGVYVKTIDAYASANTNRVLRWDKRISGSSNHTIKVVNLATPGRPRIDVDGYVQ